MKFELSRYREILDLLTKGNTNSPGTERILRDAETEGEIVAVLFRIVIFFALVLIIISMEKHGGRFPQLIAATGIYGLISFSGLFLALRKVFHPCIPYIFVTLDITILIVELILLGMEMKLPPVLTFALPVSSIVFVLMAHAAMRYRPWLVVYTAVLFIIGMQIGVFVVGSGTGHYPSRTDLMNEQLGIGSFMHYEAFPVMVVGLCAALLFATVRRTRSLLISSIDYGRRLSRLSRYFSPSIADELASEAGESSLGGSRRLVFVLFVDIRGFSTLAESMEPDELSKFLSEFRCRMLAPVFREGGIIDKFIGDSLMVVFGTPRKHPDDAARTLRCALEMISTVKEWSVERSLNGERSVSIGIGIHYGEVFAGNIGDDRLLEYTVIGDTVNIAERLEKLTRKMDTELIVSDAFYRAAEGSVDDEEWMYVPTQELAGHSQTIDVYRFISRIATG